MRNHRENHSACFPFPHSQRTSVHLQFDQVEAAKRLGTTQAAVSQYINSKRALKGTEQFAEVMPKLQEMARVTAKRLANREITYDEISPDFCKLCVKFCVSAVDKSPEDYVI